MNFRDDDLPGPVSGLYQYWKLKRAGRPLPSRADIDPVEMRDFLPQTVLIDVVEGKRLKLRLIGTHIAEFAGANLPGRYLDEIDIGEAKQAVADVCDHAARMSEPRFLAGELPIGPEHRALAFKLLVLPLAADGGEVDMLLIGVVIRRRRPAGAKRA